MRSIIRIKQSVLIAFCIVGHVLADEQSEAIDTSMRILHAHIEKLEDGDSPTLTDDKISSILDPDLLEMVKKAGGLYAELKTLSNKARALNIELSEGYVLSPYNTYSDMLFLLRNAGERPECKIVDKELNRNETIMLVKVMITLLGDGKTTVKTKLSSKIYFYKTNGKWLITDILFQDSEDPKSFWVLSTTLKYKVIPGYKAFVDRWKKEIKSAMKEAGK